MGSVTCAAVEADPDLDLVAQVDADQSLSAVLDAGADVAVEFTTPLTVADNTVWLLEHGVHAVVGATGLDTDDLARIETATGPANCFIAPNFAIGAVLAMRTAAEIAKHLPHAEITELHHDRKVDAPSGTALRTAELIAAARSDDVEVPGPDGHPARGMQAEGIPVHSVRLPGLVASQEIIFGGQGQTLTVRHDSIDRSSFMPGVLLAVKKVGERPGLTVGLEHLL